MFYVCVLLLACLCFLFWSFWSRFNLIYSSVLLLVVVMVVDQFSAESNSWHSSQCCACGRSCCQIELFFSSSGRLFSHTHIAEKCAFHFIAFVPKLEESMYRGGEAGGKKEEGKQFKSIALHNNNKSIYAKGSAVTHSHNTDGSLFTRHTQCMPLNPLPCSLSFSLITSHAIG